MRELTPKGRKIMRLAVILGILIVALIVYWVIQSRQSPANPVTPADTLISEEPPGFTGRLPYSEEGFTINYLAESDTFIVNIYDEPVEQMKTAALRYLERNGARIPPSAVSYFYGPGVGNHTGP